VLLFLTLMFLYSLWINIHDTPSTILHMSAEPLGTHVTGYVYLKSALWPPSYDWHLTVLGRSLQKSDTRLTLSPLVPSSVIIFPDVNVILPLQLRWISHPFPQTLMTMDILWTFVIFCNHPVFILPARFRPVYRLLSEPIDISYLMTLLYLFF
jgi:hypothetical protein